MRRSSAFPIVLAALLCAFGCGGGGGTATTPLPPTGQGGVVEGDVLLNGAFVTGSTVAAYDLKTGIEVDQESADDQGHYTLHLPAGQYGLWTMAPSGNAGPEWVNVPTNLAPTTRDIALIPGAAGLLVGQVRDTKYGDPIAAAIVTFGGQTVSTDMFGFYTLKGVGTAPSGTIGVSANGFNTVDEQIRNGQGDRTEFLTTKFFTLRPSDAIGTSLGGTVRDINSGDALGGVIITLHRPTDPADAVVKGQTNLGGFWRFFNLTPGTYTVAIARPGYDPQELAAVINARNGVLNLFMGPTPGAQISISGTVYDSNGTTPLANVQVVATSGVYGSVKSSTTPTGVTNAQGIFTLDNLVVDVPYTIAFRPLGVLTNRNLPQTVVVSPPPGGVLLSISMPLNDTGGINGKVTETGMTDPPVGATIEAEKVGEPNSGQVFPSKVDTNGNFGINGLPPGQYILRASFDSVNGPVTFTANGSTIVTAGVITKRNITLP